MVFDGINFKGQTLKIRRPHDYHPTAGGGAAAGGTAGAPAGVVGGGPENPSMSTSEKRGTKSINVVSRQNTFRNFVPVAVLFNFLSY